MSDACRCRPVCPGLSCSLDQSGAGAWKFCDTCCQISVTPAVRLSVGWARWAGASGTGACALCHGTPTGPFTSNDWRLPARFAADLWHGTEHTQLAKTRSVVPRADGFAGCGHDRIPAAGGKRFLSMGGGQPARKGHQSTGRNQRTFLIRGRMDAGHRRNRTLPGERKLGGPETDAAGTAD